MNMIALIVGIVAFLLMAGCEKPLEKKPNILSVSKNNEGIESHKLHSDANLGIEFYIPKDWQQVQDPYSLAFQSRNFQAIPPRAYGDDKVTQGIRINIMKEGSSLAEHIQSSEAFVDFNLKDRDCSNCLETRKIQLSGQDAILIRTPNLLSIETVYKFDKKRSFRIVFSFNSFTKENEEIINTFIKSFSFTSK